MKCVRYVKASPLPHLVALCSLLVCAALAVWGHGHLEARRMLPAGVLLMVASGWLGLAVICLLDAVSRWREYLRIRDMLKRYGFRPRILHTVRSSRCQRDAALQAAAEAGCKTEARDFFASLGYGRRHLLPDKVMANPLYFFHPRFLTQSFLPRRDRPGRSAQARPRPAAKAPRTMASVAPSSRPQSASSRKSSPPNNRPVLDQTAS